MREMLSRGTAREGEEECRHQKSEVMMKSSQVFAIVAALAIFVTGMYPPWTLSYVVGVHNGESGVAAAVISNAVARDWLLSEKALPDRNMLQTVRAGLGYSVDFGRLGVEWAMIAAIYGAVWLLVRRDTQGR